MMTSVILRCDCCVNSTHRSLIILRANRAASVKRMILRWMQFYCARPVSCEIHKS